MDLIFKEGEETKTIIDEILQDLRSGKDITPKLPSLFQSYGELRADLTALSRYYETLLKIKKRSHRD